MTIASRMSAMARSRPLGVLANSIPETILATAWGTAGGACAPAPTFAAAFCGRLARATSEGERHEHE